MGHREIYRVDALVQLYAKEQSTSFTKLHARYKRIIKSKRFQAAFPKFDTRIALEQGTGGGSYAYVDDYPGRIRLGGNRSEAVLLHEIAHHIEASHIKYGRDRRDHGPGFAAAFVDLVHVTQGPEAARAFKHLLREMRFKIWDCGKCKPVLPRVKGEPPEAARETISKIMGWKQAEKDRRADERAKVATMMTQREWSFTETCGHGCDGMVTRTATYMVRSRKGRETVRWYTTGGRCDSCSIIFGGGDINPVYLHEKIFGEAS